MQPNNVISVNFLRNGNIPLDSSVVYMTAQGEKQRSSGMCRGERVFLFPDEKGDTNMKRMLKRTLACLLCMLLALPAMADTVVVPDEKSGYNNIVGSAVVGETVYLHEVNGTRMDILRWQDGMEQAEVVLENVPYAPNFNSLAEINAILEAENMPEAISQIFSDGEKLYGVNHFNGHVFTIDFTEQGMTCSDVVTLQNTTPLFNPDNTDWSAEAHGYYVTPGKVIKVGDWMLWQSRDRNSRSSLDRVLAFNLNTGTVKQAVLPQVAAMSTYKDGKALIVGQVGKRSYDEQGVAKQMTYTLHAYDPATDELVFMGDLKPESVSGLRTIAYSEALDLVIYQDKTRLMGWSAETGTVQVGFIPTSLSMENALCVGDKLLYRTTDNSGITAATLKKGYVTEHRINITGGTMNNIVSRFSQQWNGVPFYYTDVPAGMSLADYIVSENGPDLIKPIVRDGEFTRLLECGYFKDLSSYPEIKAYIDLLYQPYQDLVVRDSGIYGVPVAASSYRGWYINKEVMTAMGLTAADIPTDLVGMIGFAQKWNDEWAEKYPHFTLLNNTENYRSRFLHAILQEWEEYCQFNGVKQHYDDAILAEALDALDAADFTKIDAALKQTNPEISEYKQALIWTGCKDVGNFATYMEESSDRIFIPLKLTKDTPYVAAVESVQVWAVNANSANADAAVAMLVEQIKKIADVHAYVLRTDKTEPVVSDYWEDDLVLQKERLAQLESRVEESVNKETILAQIETYKEWMAFHEENKSYTIHPSAIKNYVEVIAPASVVVTYGYPDEFSAMVEAYVDKRVDRETFITRLNEGSKAE